MYIILDNNEIKRLSPEEMQRMILNSDQDTFKALSEVIENEKGKNKYFSAKKERLAGASTNR